jgi:hypothetical protein
MLESAIDEKAPFDLCVKNGFDARTICQLVQAKKNPAIQLYKQMLHFGNVLLKVRYELGKGRYI